MGNACRTAQVAEAPIQPVVLSRAPVVMVPIPPPEPRFEDFRTIEELTKYGLDREQKRGGRNGKSIPYVVWLVEKMASDPSASHSIPLPEVLDLYAERELDLPQFLVNQVVRHDDVENRTARLTLVGTLLDAGATVNSVPERGAKTPVEMAVDNGELLMCKMLIQYGASADHLIPAMKHDNTEIFQALLQSGANTSAFDRAGECVVSHAVKGGKLNILTMIAQSEQGLDGFSVDKNGIPVIAHAVAANNIEMVRLLLENGADPQALTGSGQPLIVEAVAGGNSALVFILIEAGADATVLNRDGTSLLTTAVGAGNLDLCLVLCNANVSPICSFPNDETVLNNAVRAGNYQIVQLLLDRSSPMNDRDLVLATQGTTRDHRRIARLLLNRGANASAVDSNGVPVLMHAIKQGSDQLVEDLIAQGADANHGPILEAAIMSGNERLVEILIDAGANVNDLMPLKKPDKHKAQCNCIRCHVVTRDNRCTPLHLAVRLKNPVICRVLLDHSADPCIVSSEIMNTPLHLAMRFYDNNMEPIIEMLIDAMDEVDQVNRAGQTALHRLLANSGGQGCLIVESLLLKGADPDRRTKMGNNALHVAAQNSSERIIELLVENNASSNIKNNAGKIPSQLARTARARKLIDSGVNLGLPKIYYTEICNVCDDRAATILLPCGHRKMCKDCEAQWTTNTCPDCRKPYTKSQITELVLDLIKEDE